MLNKIETSGQKLAVIYTTVSNLTQGKTLARKAISAKHAACVNIIQKVHSVYYCQNSITESDECAMIFKTTEQEIGRLEQFLLHHHPYDLPALLKLDAATSPAFLGYIGTFVGTGG